jgi:histidinol-phosphate aminotransferase
MTVTHPSRPSSDVFDSIVPPNIATIAPYEPGKPLEELERELGITGAVKLASNENPLGPSPRGIAAAQGAIAELHRYPDGAGFRLRSALAARHGVSPSEIALGAGSNELIELLVRTFCRPGVDEVVSHKYAFMMYRLACLAHGVTYREAETTPDMACDVDALLAAVTPKTRIVFLPNPNNPIGSYVARAAFEKLIDRLPATVILAVDEAYHEYAQARADYPAAESYRATKPLVVTLRTFSKIYGLAGLRVGYAICDARITSYIDRVRMPFNTSSIGQVAAIAALEDTAHVERSRKVNGDGLVQLANGVAKLDVRAYPSAGNFMLVDVKREAAPVYQAMLAKGVIVRPLKPSGLLRHLRISVSTAEENARALGALEAVLRA